jgi:hypothetical protein
VNNKTTDTSEVIAMSHLQSYSKVYAIGHAQVRDLFREEVTVEERSMDLNFLSVWSAATVTALADHPTWGDTIDSTRGAARPMVRQPSGIVAGAGSTPAWPIR